MIGLCLCMVIVTAGPADDREDAPSILGRTQLECPACHKSFTTIVCVRSNTRAGVDRDLFARSLGAQPEFYRISTCPHCGYSGYLADFDPSVTLMPDVANRILQSPGLKLPPGFGPGSDPSELDASVRYALAVTCYQWRQKSDEAIGWLYLRSSWVEREKGAHLPPDPRLRRALAYIERWRPALGSTDNQLDVEMKLAARASEALLTGRFTRYQRPYLELAVALILRRHGENTQAGSILRRLQQADANLFSEDLRTGMTAMQQSIIRERKHQEKAADAFERALLADLVSADNRPAAMYLLGELFRRLNHDAEAVKWFDRTLKEPDLPADLRGWAEEQRSYCLGSWPQE